MFTYTPNFIPSSIVLVGCGGTGSRLLPMLSQLIRTSIQKFNPNAWIPELPLYLIDGDRVEEKNLLRQNFIQKDVGKYKSIALANRYSAAFDIPIYASTEFLTSDRRTFSFEPQGTGAAAADINPFSSSIWILAVDSAQARREILAMLANWSVRIANMNLFIIDAGNEDDFGQIKFGNLGVVHRGITEVIAHLGATPKLAPHPGPIPAIPLDVSYYAKLGSSVAEKSCADLPQTLAINAMMATLICCVVQNFLQLRPMSFNGFRFSMTGAASTEYMTASTMKAVMQGNRDIISHEGDYRQTSPTKDWAVTMMERLSYLRENLIPTKPFIDYATKNRSHFTSMGWSVLPNGDVMPPEPKKVEPPAPAEPPPELVPLMTEPPVPKKPRPRRSASAQPAIVTGGEFNIEDLDIEIAQTDSNAPTESLVTTQMTQDAVLNGTASSAPPLQPYRG